MSINVDLLPPDNRGVCPQELSFGNTFSDHMFTQQYDVDTGWHHAAVQPFHDFTLHPAASVLHYGQAVFEGLKAYRRADGGINLFRPDQNVRRFNLSADRLVMPRVDEQFHIEAIETLVQADQTWVPDQSGASLYIRPAMFASTPQLGLGAASSYVHFIIAGPVGPYFKEGFNPVSVYVSEVCRRAVIGGIGEAKTGGNYAASLFVGEEAARKGYTQVLWLDAIEGRFVEEVGAMNICFVYKDGTIVTPALSGSILAGITRDSVLQLAPTLGYPVKEDRLDIDTVLEEIASGEITEVFGCGTAAAISPVGRLAYKGRDYTVNDNKSGPVAQRLFEELTAIQYGTAEDLFSWIHAIA
ncbi:MAG: branched chain amino acid aminotransferase [Gammaproteobacteria bacterium]|nr:MAG: branched chain amino acid aminotransferase [Gammaproteobacteria bacterium]